MALFGILNSAPYKKLVIPRSDSNGYQLIVENANGVGVRITSSIGEGNKFGQNSRVNVNSRVELSVSPNNSDDVTIITEYEISTILFGSQNNEPTSIDLTKQMDLSHFVLLDTISLGAAGINLTNLKLPQIIVPLKSFFFGRVFSRNIQTNVAGILDMTPLNVNGMFGGRIESVTDNELLEGVILPTNVRRPVTSLRLSFPSDTQEGVIDLSSWSRLGGEIEFSNMKKVGFVLPTFVELDAPIITTLEIASNALDKANIPGSAQSYDLSAMHNLGGDIKFIDNELEVLILPTQVLNEVSSFIINNNPIANLDASVFKDFNGILYVHLCELTSLTLPPVGSTTFSALYFYNNPNLNINTLDLTGYDLSNFQLRGYNVGSFSSMTIPVASRSDVLSLWVYENDFTSFDFEDYSHPAGVDLRVNRNAQPLGVISFNNTNIKIVQVSNSGITSIDLSGALISSDAIIFLQENPVTVFIDAPASSYSGRPDTFATSGTSQLSNWNVPNLILDWSDPIKVPHNFTYLGNSGIVDMLMPSEGSDVGVSRRFWMSGNLFSNLDLRGFKDSGPSTLINNCPNLTTILFKSTGLETPNYTRNQFYQLAIHDNPNLIPPDFSQVFAKDNTLPVRVSMQDNNWTTTQVNKVLSDIRDLAVLYNYTLGIYDISGTNGSPDASSGGFDGLQAVSDLVNMGHMITTN